MAILQGARITGSIIATSFIKATGFSGSLTASNLYVLGKAGIGTSSPGTKLEVVGSIRAGSFPVLVTNTGEAWFGRGSDRTLGSYTLQFGGTSATSTYFEIIDRAWTKVIFAVSGEAPDNTFKINTSGNVGIGSGSPAYKLDVAGSAYAYNYFTLLTAATYGPSDNSAAMQVFGSTGSGGLTNTIKFLTNGSERVRIDSSGNVGIGTSSPSNKLYVNGDGYFASTLYIADNTAVNFGNTSQIYHNSSRGSTQFTGTGGSDTICIKDSNGYVGIGTTSPGAKLDVNGDVYISPNTAGKNTFILSTNASNDARLLMKSDTTTKVDIQSNGTSYFNGGNVGIGLTNPNTRLQVSGSATIGGYNAFYFGTGVNSLNITAPLYPVLAFYYGTNLAGIITGYSDHIGLNTGVGGSKYISFEPGDSEIMRITAAGNVGIGTTSPAYKLEVASGTSGQQSLVNFRTADSTTANNAGIQIFATPSATATSREAVMALDADGANASGGDYFLIKKRGNSGTTDFEQYSNASMRFGTNFISRATYDMTIANDGNVGIGTTSPIAKLDIRPTTDGDAGISIGTGGAVSGTICSPANLFINANTGNAQSGDGRIAFGFQRTGFTGGSEVMRIIENNGYVGIGTTSPVNKLHVSGSSTNLPLKLEGLTSNATGYFLTVDNTTGVVYKSTSGASGTSGTSGANGSPGTSGSSGTSGANGSPGTSGSSGSGSSGISGSSGTSGTTNIKAWVHFDGTGTPTINASLNVSSITDNNTGDYTINFTTAFANANYVVAGTVTYEYENPGQSINNMFIAVPRRPTAQLAGSCRISTPGSDNVLYDCKYVRVLFSN